MKNWIPFLTTLVDATDKIALQYYQSVQLQTQIKKDNTIVSEADLAIETYVRNYLDQHAPELAVLGEEYGGAQTDANLRLIIDPIDGTKNFVAGIPFFATLLAIEEKGEIVAGLISAPATHDRWWASKGQGAFHNGRRIHVSKIAELSEATAFHSSVCAPKITQGTEKLLALLQKTRYQRGYGDYLSPMFVASGAGEFAIDSNIKPWDMAPIKIIIEEAGGKFTDTKGENTIYSGNMIVSNGLLHESVLKSLDGLF